MSGETAIQSAQIEAQRTVSPTISPDKAPALAKLQTLGADELCSMVESGMTMAEIARSLEVSPAAIYKAMDRFGWREQIARAMEQSAEAWLDRGLEAIAGADESSNAAVNKWRYFAIECARRAGVRNARYSERQSVELSGPNGGPIQAQSVVTVYVPQNNRDAGQTIDLAGQDYVENTSD